MTNRLVTLVDRSVQCALIFREVEGIKKHRAGCLQNKIAKCSISNFILLFKFIFYTNINLSWFYTCYKRRHARRICIAIININNRNFLFKLNFFLLSIFSQPITSRCAIYFISKLLNYHCRISKINIYQKQVPFRFSFLLLYKFIQMTVSFLQPSTIPEIKIFANWKPNPNTCLWIGKIQ